MTATAKDATVVAAERWFIRHGLPYLVDDERAAVRRGLQPSRLGPVVALSALGAVVVGFAVGLVAEVSLGISTAMTVFGAVLAVYAATVLRAWAIARWAVARTFASLGLLFPLVTRALPLLLLFVTFLFINAEVWQVSAELDGGVMWVTVLLFAGIAVVFLLVRLPEELDQVDDVTDPERLAVACKGTPLESAAQELAASGVAIHRDTSVRGFQKANLILVLLVAQVVQVLLLSVSVLAFFIVFGAVAMKKNVVESWIGAVPQSILGLDFVTVELVQVSVFLAAFSGLYFTVYAVTDETYRNQFFTSITRELERAVGARAVYHALKSSG